LITGQSQFVIKHQSLKLKHDQTILIGKVDRWIDKNFDKLWSNHKRSLSAAENALNASEKGSSLYEERRKSMVTNRLSTKSEIMT